MVAQIGGVELVGVRGRRFRLLDSLFLLRQGLGVDAALLADFRKVAVHVRNLGGGFVDGFQTGPQFLQLLALGPGGNIAEAVLAGFDAEILADCVGNAFGLHFLGVAVLLYDLGSGLVLHDLQPPLKFVFIKMTPPGFFRCRLRVRFCFKAVHEVSLGPTLADHDNLPTGYIFCQRRIVELGVCDLVDQRGDGLHLAHALPDGDGLIGGAEIPVRVRGDGLEGDGDRRGPAQGLRKVQVNVHGQTWKIEDRQVDCRAAFQSKTVSQRVVLFQKGKNIRKTAYLLKGIPHKAKLL